MFYHLVISSGFIYFYVAERKARGLPLLAPVGSLRHSSSGPLVGRSPQPRPLSTIKWARGPSLCSQAIFRRAWEPALPSAESLSMSEVKLFLPSWRMCGAISLRSESICLLWGNKTHPHFIGWNLELRKVVIYHSFIHSFNMCWVHRAMGNSMAKFPTLIKAGEVVHRKIKFILNKWNITSLS